MTRAAKPRPLVLIGLLGPVLDNGRGEDRWDRWRPSVDLLRQEDLAFARFELLHQRKFATLAKVVRDDIALVSPQTAVQSHAVEFDNPWDFEEVYGVLYDFAHRYPWKPDAEDYLVHITTGTHVAQICLFLLTESRHLPARLVQSTPPPRARRTSEPGTYDIIDLDLSKYDRLAARFEQAARDDVEFLKSGIATRNPDFNSLISRLERVALRSTAPLLLLGPTGAGKSQLARRVYELKRLRRQVEGRFVEVNCATLRGDNAMAALFGHRKGAFTGAVAAREGLLRAAHGGLLFLDEIGELGLDEQAMLLRALEEKRFLPLGADEEAESDFQLIAGTNRDLAGEVRAGHFREDLLARVNLWTFRLPGLADRREDIEPNLDYELARATRAGGTNVTMSRAARERFLAFAHSDAARWTANFRDLGGAVARMATLAEGGRISEADVDDETARLLDRWRDDADPDAPDRDRDDAFGLSASWWAERDRFDAAQLREVLSVCARSRTLAEAGRTLFAASRAGRRTVNDSDRLRKYLARFGLVFRDGRVTEG